MFSCIFFSHETKEVEKIIFQLLKTNFKSKIDTILPFSPRFFAWLTVSMETRKFKIQNGGKTNDLKAKLILLS